MQGSFWKTVAVVGVIGIGSLALLEVQSRLSKGNVTAESESTESLDEHIASTGDQTINGKMSDSDLEKFLNGEVTADAFEADAQFEMKEPFLATAAATVTMSAEDQFLQSEPVPAQPAMPPVNTNVQIAALASDGNPFEQLGKTVSAAYQTSDAEAKEPIAAVVFHPEEEATQFLPDNAPSFATFDAETEPAVAAPQLVGANPLVPTPEAHPVPETASSESPAPNKFAFFGADGDAAASVSATDLAQPPEKTAQFYENEQPAEPEAATFDAAAPEMFPGDTGTNVPARTSPLNTIPASQSQNPETFEPKTFEAETFEPESFEAETFAPEPFKPEPVAESFNDDVPLPTEAAEPRFDTPLPQPEIPARPIDDRSIDDRSSFGGESLPFIADEDVTSQPGSLSIPGFNSTTPETPQAGDGFDPQSDFMQGTPLQDTRPLSQPVPTDRPNRNIEAPVRQYNEPGIRMNDNVREFGGESDRFDTIPERPPLRNNSGFDSRQDDTRSFERQDFDTAPRNDRFPGTRREITPDFNSSLDDLSTRPLQDRKLRGGSSVRQVSGRMSPNLVLEKTAPENATVGSPLDYHIFVKNEGDATAYDVVVDDDVTSAAKIEGAHPQSDFDKSARKLIWQLGEIAPGETKKITVRVTPTGEGVLDGTASVKFKTRVKATTIVTAPKLRLQMEGPDQVRIGEEVAYRYIITNEGTGEARKVFIRTLLPASGGLKHAAGRDLEYEISAMKPGEQREIMLAVVAGEPGEHSAKAEVSATGGATATAGWRTEVIGSQLQIVRRGPRRRFVNRSATYENVITNGTNFEAVDAKVVEQLPQGMKFMGATMGGRYNEAEHTVTWMINRLGPQRSEQLELELMPTIAGNMQSVVRILENVGVQSEDYVSTTVVEDIHLVSATISQLDGPVAKGDAFGFTINIDNRGTAEATDVGLRVEVPREIQVIGAGSRETPAKLIEGSNTVQYDMIIRIAPGIQKSFELKLRGRAEVQNGAVKAMVQYKQMSDPLIVSESVTVFDERL